MRQVEGSRAYLKAMSAPSIDLRAGAALLFGYLMFGKDDTYAHHIENGRSLRPVPEKKA